MDVALKLAVMGLSSIPRSPNGKIGSLHEILSLTLSDILLLSLDIRSTLKSSQIGGAFTGFRVAVPVE